MIVCGERFPHRQFTEIINHVVWIRDALPERHSRVLILWNAIYSHLVWFLVLVARGWMVGDLAQLLFFCGMKKKMDPFAVSLLLLLVLITTPQTNVSP